MLEDALAYPTNGDSGLARILIGGALALIGSFLFIPTLMVYGYLLRTMAGASRGEEEPPAFEEWVELLVEGVKAMVVGLAYGLIPGVLLVVTLFLTGAGASAEGTTGGIMAAVGAIGFFAIIVLLLVLQYALPAAFTNMAREDDLAAAFDFDTLKPVLTSRDYVLAVVLTFGVALVGGLAFVLFSVVTVGIGLILAPFFYFWLYLAGAYMFGAAFGSAVEPAGGTASTEVEMA